MKIKIDVNIFLHSGADPHIESQLNRIIDALTKLETKLSNELADLTTQVAETNTVIGSAVVLIQGLKAALDAAGTDPVALKALSDSLNTSEQALAAAVVAGTPAVAAPAPVV